jgi:hypothetical protein
MRLIGAVAAFVLQASALAAGPSSIPEHRWTLRGDFVINTASDPLPGDAVLAVSLGRRLGRHLAAEATVGPGLPSTTLARDAGGGTRHVDVASGLHGAVLLRVDRKLTSSGRSSLSLAAGPSLVSGSAYGTVPMARAELGFDLRFRRAWIFSYGIGYESALATSRTPFAASECVVSGCQPQYRAGVGQVTSRVGLGFTF